MKHKIVGIVICMLMILTVFPVAGLPIQTGQTKNSYFTQLHYQTPIPGDAPNPSSETLTEIPVARKHPEKTPATLDEIVINMLEQVDETIYLSYLENLTTFGPRVTGSNACEAAAAYIYNQFATMGLAVRYHNWTSGGYSSANVEATINGTNESSDEIYIICAHYDTVAAGPGADDDSSGTVAVLMAALIMSEYQFKFNHTIKFVAFSGEEQGLLGSKAYAANAAAEGWNIVGVLNADMISYAVTTIDGKYLIVFVNDASEWLYDYTFNISTEYADYIHLSLVNGGMYGHSDHWYFWGKGYSALFYYEYFTTPYYHTSGDTIAHINATYAIKNIRLMLATLAELSEVTFNNPPNTPTITGETNGAIQTLYTYVIQTTDSDQDDVKYFIDWGDTSNSGWIGPYTIGQKASANHSWSSDGSYAIKVKAKDEHGAESDWATLTVTMPYSYTKLIPQFLQMLFQRVPNAFPILRQLMGY
jgi:Peptidase family M28